MPAAQWPAFDTECDFAALVYRRGEHPDELIAAFARDLAAGGADVAGLVHRHLLADAPPELVTVPGGEPVAASASPLDAPVAWLAEAIKRKPDLVVINRFGYFERSGGGFIPVVHEALSLGLPVLLAVPEALYEDWRTFSGGLAVRLDCRRETLERWWTSLGNASRQGTAT